jgi:uncharacterized protein YegP (UPF0339 family)
MAAKFVVKKGTTGKFRFSLHASNGEIIATSETYNTKAAALRSTTRPWRRRRHRRRRPQPSARRPRRPQPRSGSDAAVPPTTAEGSDGRVLYLEGAASRHLITARPECPIAAPGKGWSAEASVRRARVAGSAHQRPRCADFAPGRVGDSPCEIRRPTTRRLHLETAGRHR